MCGDSRGRGWAARDIHSTRDEEFAPRVRPVRQSAARTGRTPHEPRTTGYASEATAAAIARTARSRMGRGIAKTKRT